MQIKPELQFILNILKQEIIQSNKISQEDLNVQLQTALNWDYLLQLVIRHRIIPQAYNYLKDRTYVPAAVSENLTNLYQQIKIQNLSMLRETIRITRELKNHDIKYIIVKGLPLAHIAYGDYSKRQAKDIDILIDPKDLEKAQNIIINLGFEIKYPTYKLHGFKKDYYLSNFHDITLFNSTNNVEVELHFSLNYLGLKFFDFKDIPAQSLSISNHNIYTTIDIFHLIYLMQHGSIHAYSRMRWVHDIALYITNTDVDLTKVFALAKLLNSEHIMLQTLLLIQQIYNLENHSINEIIEKNSSKKSQDLANTALEFIISDYDLGNNNGIFNKMFLKYRIYLSHIATKGQKINQIFEDLIQIDKLFPYITMPKYMSLGYYLLYPLVALRYFRK